MYKLRNAFKKQGILALFTLILTIFLTQIKVNAVPIQKEFKKATKAELTDTLVIDGHTWTRVSSIEPATEIIPEVSFTYHRDVEIDYYIEWVHDSPDGSRGHFNIGQQSNSWSKEKVPAIDIWADSDNGFGVTEMQKGYGIWPEHSLWSVTNVVVSGVGGGVDFFNKSFTVNSSSGIQFRFTTTNSFTDNVSFYAPKEIIEGYLKSKGDPNDTFNISDYTQTAYLEKRTDKEAGIHYQLYKDYFKTKEFETLVKNRMVPNSEKPTSNEITLEWMYSGGHTYLKSGRYGNQDFNYVAPAKTITTGYKATYERVDSELTGQIITDKPSYAAKSTDTNITIQAKEQTDVSISDTSFVKEIGARVTNYSVNGGADIAINKSKTSSNVKTISTDYVPITLTVSSLKDGNNTVTIKGYSWWKDDLGKIEEINTTKTVTVTKTAASKPIAVIEAPTSIHAGDTVEVKGSGSDPTGLSITEYSWTSSNGQAITGTGGNIKVVASVTLTLKVKNSAGVWSDTVTHTINTENEPPTAQIIIPPTVYLGDDVLVQGYGYDKDNDPLEYYWHKPVDMYGTLEGQSGVVYFMDLGKKDFKLLVYDTSGDAGYAESSTNVVVPYPSVNIQTKGTLKANRKVILDGTSSTGGSKRIDLDWTKATWEVTAVLGGTVADIKTVSSYNGTKTMDFVFKKAGTYKAKLTLTNTLGLTKTEEKIFVIEEDKVPIADFTFVKTGIRDPEDLSSTGKPQGTFEINDLSTSVDNDTIVKRAYFVIFDENNNGDWNDDMCYVYDLDFNGTKQMPMNDSDNLHLRSIGLYKDFTTFNIDNINTGNLTSFKFKTTHVGKYLFEVVVKEEFGQPTIEQFVTPGDRKTGTTYE